MTAHFLFHVSSEGELEQVRPLIEEFLRENKLIELIYTSESVNEKCEKMYLENPINLRILRLPLLSFFPISFLYFQSIWSWATAPTIIMCRYDFFPELLFFKFFKRKLVLVSGTTKKLNWYKKCSFHYFDLIIAANTDEHRNFVGLGLSAKLDTFDFRVPRIFHRYENREFTLNQNDATVELFRGLKSSKKSDRVIIGSCWESDLEIFNNSELIKDIKSGSLQVFIAPHKLNEATSSKLSSFFQLNFLNEEIKLITKDSVSNFGKINILMIPGILCELYSEFDIAYVGGGYEKSIHSVLEPYLMGAKVLIGPLIHRSTEYDYIKSRSPNEIIVLSRPQDFYEEYKKLKLLSDTYNIRDKLRVEENLHFQEILKGF